MVTSTLGIEGLPPTDHKMHPLRTRITIAEPHARYAHPKFF
jgi:hypothetical protein